MWEGTSSISLVQTDTKEISNCGTVMGYQKDGCLLPFREKLKQFEMPHLPGDLALSNMS